MKYQQLAVNDAWVTDAFTFARGRSRRRRARRIARECDNPHAHTAHRRAIRDGRLHEMVALKAWYFIERHRHGATHWWALLQRRSHIFANTLYTQWDGLYHDESACSLAIRAVLRYKARRWCGVSNRGLVMSPVITAFSSPPCLSRRFARFLTSMRRVYNAHARRNNAMSVGTGMTSGGRQPARTSYQRGIGLYWRKRRFIRRSRNSSCYSALFISLTDGEHRNLPKPQGNIYRWREPMPAF